MSAVTNLCGLPLGQTDEPTPDLVAAVASALADPDLVALANQVASTYVEIMLCVGSRHHLQHAVMIGLANGEPPAAVLQRALANARAEIENANRELVLSASRLTSHLNFSRQ
ncbi:hypothetical protein ACLIKD_06790 [Azonexus sp. IMCC34842]|uniref:hypothetical protein n=1 Tax=Azonexus sp. IMCC34842 TaxID=3420950 RepID=UPI003D0D4980